MEQCVQSRIFNNFRWFFFLFFSIRFSIAFFNTTRHMQVNINSVNYGNMSSGLFSLLGIFLNFSCENESSQVLSLSFLCRFCCHPTKMNETELLTRIELASVMRKRKVRKEEGKQFDQIKSIVCCSYCSISVHWTQQRKMENRPALRFDLMASMETQNHPIDNHTFSFSQDIFR